MSVLYAYLLVIIDFIREYSATIIAICALLLTVIQAYISRKHNRLSVKPSLTVSTYAEYDAPNRYVCVIELINAGLGPAIVDDYIIVYDGKEYYFTNHEEFFSLIYDDVFPDNCIYKDDYFYLFRYGSVIPAGESQEILEISFHFKDDDELKVIQEKIKKFSLKIKHHSIYDQKFTYDTSKHERSK